MTHILGGRYFTGVDLVLDGSPRGLSMGEEDTRRLFLSYWVVHQQFCNTFKQSLRNCVTLSKK